MIRLRPLLGLAWLATVAGCASSPAPEPEKPEPAEAKAPDVDPRYEKLPTPTLETSWSPPAVEKEALENGLTLWQMKHGSAPLLSIHFMFPVGSASDPKGKAGLTLLAANWLDEGAGKYSALELNDRLGELATDYSSTGGNDFVLLSMNALAENLEPSLELLADIVARPRLEQSEFDRLKKLTSASAIAGQEDPRQARSRAIGFALFGDGYASKSNSGTPETIDSITFEEAKAHAKKLTAVEGAHITVAGATDVAKTKALVKKYFGQLKGKASLSSPEPEAAPEGGKAYVVDFPDAAQSSIAVAMRAGGDSDPNLFAEDVMNEKLSGSFTGRVNMNLREDKGYTYGAFGLFRRFKKAGYFGVMADVKSETTGASIKEVFKELKDVCGDRPLTDAERNDSVAGKLLGFPLDFDQVSSLGYRLASIPLRDRPVDYWSTWRAKTKEVSTSRANEAAKPYCDPSKYTVIVSGDMKSVAPMLEELSLEVIALDRNGIPLETKK